MHQWDKKGSLSDSRYSKSTAFSFCKVPAGFAYWPKGGLTQNIQICYNLRFGANKWSLKCFWLNRLLHRDSKGMKLLVFPSFWQIYLLIRFKSPSQLGHPRGVQPDLDGDCTGRCAAGWGWPRRCSFTLTRQRAECCRSCQQLPVLWENPAWAMREL